VGVNDLGEAFKRKLFARDSDKLGHDKTNGSQHGGAAVLELGFAEPGQPLGSAL
jgi:hypothetical protein